jgi:hypothetical protein
MAAQPEAVQSEHAGEDADELDPGRQEHDAEGRGCSNRLAAGKVADQRWNVVVR